MEQTKFGWVMLEKTPEYPENMEKIELSKEEYWKVAGHSDIELMKPYFGKEIYCMDNGEVKSRCLFGINGGASILGGVELKFVG